MLFFALTIFTGAFLLFQVQPMIGKYILPWFGGGPGVWTTCMLFFQIVLLGGYAYAHLISRRLKPRTQVVVHLAVLGAALVLLPITPSDAWKPHGPGDPRLKILLVLAISVGLPYFALSATGPLIQHWFSRAKPGVSPYRLYALSNVGSLVALLSYPIYFEVQFTRTTQALMWGGGLCAFAVCCGICAVRVWKSAVPTPQGKVAEARKSGKPIAAAATPAIPDARPAKMDQLLWLLLPACASVLLLATTNKVCQEVTVIPLLWVVPLALYLLSFIISFDNPRWYRRLPFAIALAIAVGGICYLLLTGLTLAIPSQLAIYAGGLFVCCMVCHGELYRLRPSPAHLTGFYMMIAAGGALGGVFVTLVAPLIFTGYDELPWGLLLCAGLLVVVWLRKPDAGRFDARRAMVFSVSSLIALAGVGALVSLEMHQSDKHAVARSRNFYGTLAVVKEDPSQSSMYCLRFYHGITTHGLQFLDPKLAASPTTYFSESSGVGRVLRSPSAGPRRIGLIGLGAGTLAAYPKNGDYLRIYEINPEVERLARSYFTFLTNCAGRVDVILGDARLSMERESPQNFDVLIMDAFNSDAIPMHLLTREAFELYQHHLKPGGIIAVHISNRYLDLKPVITAAAAHFDYHAVVITDHQSRDKWWLLDSVWMVLSRDQEIFHSPLVESAAAQVRTDATFRLWTDDFASLYPIIRFQAGRQTAAKPTEAQDAVASDLSEKGDVAGAIAHYHAALQLNPEDTAALNNLAWMLATDQNASMRNGPEAVRLAEKACQLTEYRRTLLVGTLGAAYAEAGRFPEAIATAEKACALASQSGDEIMAAKNRELLELYRQGKPYHEPPAPGTK